MVEAGLIQRTRALNMFLDDLYAGQRAAVRDGIIPGWLIQSSDGYKRAAFGIGVKGGARVAVAGIDIVRDDLGVYRVLEDNLRVPSGISYVIENRAAMRRAFPAALRSVLDSPGRRLRVDAARGDAIPGSGGSR